MSTMASVKNRCEPAGGEVLAGFIDNATSCLDGLGGEPLPGLARLGELGGRLAEQRFHLAVLGQFKRGKSTFLNALLGEPVLPTAVVPLTAVPTFVEFAPHPGVRIAYDGERPPEAFRDEPTEALRARIFAAVAEQANPHNRSGVARVDVFHPAPMLGEGMVLIDTPGVGSTFRHNTETAVEFLEQCDAAIFVVSVDPPITAAELAFLSRVRKHVRRLVFVLNKIDYLAADERQAALRFLEDTLRREGFDTDAPIFCLSAKLGLEAKQKGDARLRAASGLEAVEHYLVDVLSGEKADLLRLAIATKTAAVLDEMLMDLTLRVRSLEMPLEDLAERLAAFDRTLADVERQRVSARDLLAGDLRRAKELLEDEAERLRGKGHTFLLHIVERELPKLVDGATDRKSVLDALAAAIPDFFGAELAGVARGYAMRVADWLRPHQQRADALIGSVRCTAAELFDIPFQAHDPGDAFETARRPYWVTRAQTDTLIPLTDGALDGLLPRPVRQARLKRRLIGDADELVRRNVENLRWATLQNLEATFRKFGVNLDRRLAETIDATHGAIRAAYRKRQEHSEHVAAEVGRLNRAVADVQSLQEDLDQLVTNMERGRKES
jgi:nucleoside 2-deoxyribosyltransferase